MNFFSTFTRLLWYRLLNWQMVATVATLVLLYQFVLRNHAFLDLIGRLLAKLELRMTGNYDNVPENGDTLVTAHKTKASWELRKGQTSVYAVQGRRPRMEDRFNVVSKIQNTSIFGVFDGHGGEFASDFVEKSLFKSIMLRLLKSSKSCEKIDWRGQKNEDNIVGDGDNFGSGERGENEGRGEGVDMEKLLVEEILNVDRALLEAEKETGDISGTTLLLATLNNHKLVVANVGDSRGVLCDQYNDVVPLSFDHKPQLANERRRIKQAGGFVSFNGVWRVAGILATSRALGDFPLKDKGFVVADPDILTFDLRKFKPKFMILATDGLWDVFTNEEAVAFISTRLDEAHFGAKSLVLQAYYRGSLDNITVIVVRFAYDEEGGQNGRKEKGGGKVRKSEEVKKSRDKVVGGKLSNGGVLNSGGVVKKDFWEADEKEFVGGGKVVGVGRVVELDGGGVVFKEKDASTLVDTSINEGVVEDEVVVEGGVGRFVGGVGMFESNKAKMGNKDGKFVGEMVKESGEGNDGGGVCEVLNLSDVVLNGVCEGGDGKKIEGRGIHFNAEINDEGCISINKNEPETSGKILKLTESESGDFGNSKTEMKVNVETINWNSDLERADDVGGDDNDVGGDVNRKKYGKNCHK